MKPLCLLVLLLVGAAFAPCRADIPDAVKALSDTSPSALKPLPAPWKSVDIGTVAVPGAAFSHPKSGAFRITASGEDIFGRADSFRFTSQPLHGSGEIAAQVVSYERQDMWTKVGVMVRDSDAPGAKFADIVLTPDKGAEFQWRAGTDGETQTSEQTPAPTPYWVKLTRRGDVFVGWISPDGKTWTERGRTTIAMGPNVLAGICVTSHKNDALTQANLSSVTVTPAARP